LYLAQFATRTPPATSPLISPGRRIPSSPLAPLTSSSSPFMKSRDPSDLSPLLEQATAFPSCLGPSRSGKYLPPVPLPPVPSSLFPSSYTSQLRTLPGDFFSGSNSGFNVPSQGTFLPRVTCLRAGSREPFFPPVSPRRYSPPFFGATFLLVKAWRPCFGRVAPIRIDFSLPPLSSRTSPGR